MKVYISADMEGISRITSMEQVESSGRDYQKARKFMTEEVNIVIEALFKNGVDEIILNDAHNTMDNILAEELYAGVTLISGSPKPLSMMEGIDQSFDAVFFVGYHARAGTAGANIDHTYAYRVMEARVNGQPMSEAGLNGRLAGYFGVPVAFLSGDQQAVSCAEEELDNPVGVVVKESISRNAARIYSADYVKQILSDGAAQAVGKIGALSPTREEGELKLEITFPLAEMAEVSMLIPGIKRDDARQISYTTSDYLEMFKVFRALLILTSGIN